MKTALIATMVLVCGLLTFSRLRNPPGISPSREALEPGAPSGAGMRVDGDNPQQSSQRRKFKAVGRTIPTPSVAAPDTNAPPPKILVDWNGRWYPAEVVVADGNRRFIRYTGYGDEWNEWVGPERIREDFGAPEAAAATEQPRMQPESGDLVVRWGERWWRAEVLEQRGGSNLIRYVGYGPEWDEWVTPDRARTFTEADAVEATKAAAQKLTTFSNDVVQPVASPWEVDWGGRWWPADILEERDGKYLIQYAGYREDWNEWIVKDRLRVPSSPQQ